MDVYTRKHSTIYYIGWSVLLLVIIAFATILTWMLFPSRATAESLTEAKAVPGLTLEETTEYYQLSNNGASTTDQALIFYPGAHVASNAYLAKLAPQAVRGVTVFVVKSPLQFAIFDPGAAGRIIAAHTGVKRWYVGGHSLGGVVACMYAKDHVSQLSGLFFFGSYCSGDISGTTLPVLSLGGSQDGLSTPAKIQAAKHLNPPSALYLVIPGADHADFGDYGKQFGDQPSTTTRLEVKQAITDALTGFIPVPQPQ